MNGNNNYKSFNTTFKDFALIVLLLTVFYFLLSSLTNYQERMKTYNHHICVNIYGLDEHCREGVK